MLEKTELISQLKASDIMNKVPKNIDEAELAVNAMQLLEKYNINQLVVTQNEKYVGFIHLHDLLREGIL